MTMRPRRFNIRPSSFLKLEGFSVGNLPYYFLQTSCANKLLLLFLACEVRKKMTDNTFSSDFHNSDVWQLLVVGSNCRPEAIVCQPWT